jgi:hypothetical protein
MCLQGEIDSKLTGHNNDLLTLRRGCCFSSI